MPSPYPCAHPGPSPAHPVALHIRLKAVHVLVHQAPSHHDLRAIIEVLVRVLGEVQDVVLGVLHLHARQERVGYLLVETLEARSESWSPEAPSAGTERTGGRAPADTTACH